MSKGTKRFSRVNGMSTKLNKPFTAGSYAYIADKAGELTAQAIANVLHRPVGQVRVAARKLGVSFR